MADALRDGNGTPTMMVKDAETGEIKPLDTSMLTPPTSTTAWGEITGEITDQEDLQTALGTKEVTSNKVTSISGSSTDTQYPSAKLVYDQLALKETKKSVGSATTAPDVSGTYTLTVDVDTYKEYLLTAQANPFTVAAPTGTPVAGQKLILRFKDNGTARAITWNAVFRAGDLSLPTTTVISKTMYAGFEWNATDSKWDLIALVGNF